MNPVNLVHACVVEALNCGEDMAAFFSDLLQNRHANNQLIGPAVFMLTSCYVLAREKGFIVCPPEDPMVDFLGASQNRILFDLTKSLNANPVLAGDQLSGLVGGINCARRAGCTWHIPDQPEQAPIPVEIVGMVDRVTRTEVMRDSKGVITGSKQTESDSIQAV